MSKRRTTKEMNAETERLLCEAGSAFKGYAPTTVAEGFVKLKMKPEDAAKTLIQLGAAFKGYAPSTCANAYRLMRAKLAKKAMKPILAELGLDTTWLKQ